MIVSPLSFLCRDAAQKASKGKSNTYKYILGASADKYAAIAISPPIGQQPKLFSFVQLKTYSQHQGCH